jgi:hypothetical protein
MMTNAREQYVRPTLIQLQYQADLAVSMGTCKSNFTAGAGSTVLTCNLADPDQGGACNTVTDT